MKLLLFFVLPVALWCAEIELWHTFTDESRGKFDEIIDRFHESSNHRVRLVYQEIDERQIVEKTIAVRKKEKGPNLLLLSDQMLFSCKRQPIFVSARALLGSELLPKEKYFSFAHSALDAGCLPWAARAGVIYYNKHAFIRIGLNPEKPPKTWEEFEHCVDSLRAAGFAGFTANCPITYFLEHFCAIHNLPFVTSGFIPRFCFDGPQELYHWKKFAVWARRGVYHYSERSSRHAECSFTSGECGILFDRADRYETLVNRADFPVGVGKEPFWKELVNKPSSLPLDCLSFWVVEGFSEEQQQAILDFLEFVSLKETQLDWHLSTGFLPVYKEVYHECVMNEVYRELPALAAAVESTIETPISHWTKAIRVPYYAQVRENLIDHFEMMIRGEEVAQLALSNAVREANELLEIYKVYEEE